ncbi:McrC family protein [Geodermatophilus sp. SYSU D01105]
MCQRIALAENGPPQDVVLDGAVAAALAASELVRVEPRPGGAFLLLPGARVGAVRVRHEDAEVDLSVAPKVGIARLLFMLAYTSDPGWRDDMASLARAPDLLSAVVEALGRAANSAVEGGVLQGYRTLDKALPVVRGRILAASQMTRRLAFPLPIEVRHDEYDTDIAENQILRAACRVGLRVARITPATRSRLMRVVARLDGVSPLRDGAPRPLWRRTRLNARYVPALRLAELVLDRVTIESSPVRGVEAHGFVVTMWKVFEDFVTVALAEALRHHSGTTRRQYPINLDAQGLVPMRPDLVHLRGAEPVAVVDAKYKAERIDGFPNADAYQVLAYCTALRLTRGHLIYAKGLEEKRRYDIPANGISIDAHALDLGGTPAQLLERIERLAEILLEGD